jgi:hypothetical protein
MSADPPVHTLTLTDDEIAAVGALLDTVRWPDDAGRVELLSRRLPERVQEFLLDFRRAEPAGACVLRGYPLDEERVGPTPLRWKDA